MVTFQPIMCAVLCIKSMNNMLYFFFSLICSIQFWQGYNITWTEREKPSWDSNDIYEVEINLGAIPYQQLKWKKLGKEKLSLTHFELGYCIYASF